MGADNLQYIAVGYGGRWLRFPYISSTIVARPGRGDPTASISRDHGVVALVVVADVELRTTALRR